MSLLLKRRVRARMGRATKKIYRRLFSLIGFGALPVIRRDDSKDDEYIVSLTSWEPRFDVLPVALKSILLQTRRPDRVILYLGSDVDPEKLPLEVRRFEEKGVEIRFMEENLRRFYITAAITPLPAELNSTFHRTQNRLKIGVVLSMLLIRKNINREGQQCSRTDILHIKFSAGFASRRLDLIAARSARFPVNFYSRPEFQCGRSVLGICFPSRSRPAIRSCQPSVADNNAAEAGITPFSRIAE